MSKYCMRCMRVFEKEDVCPHCGEIHPQKKIPHLLLPGAVLNERYLIGFALGQGGFGITYIGYDTKLNRRVAVKEYYPRETVSRNVDVSPEVFVTNTSRMKDHESGKEKFLREAQLLGELHEEDGVVDVMDFFEENNTAYIVMEYLDGLTLQQCLDLGRISPGLMIRMIRPVARSVGEIHSHHLIHRDISPDNIMVLRSGKMKLMDFGAARQVDFTDPKSLSVVLKPGFAPGEQWRSRGKWGPWTDVYALCATMYACMTGKVPVDSLSREDGDPVKWPSELGVDIPPAFEDLLKKGMALKIEDRYQSMGELLEDLDQIEIPDEPGPNHPAGDLTNFTRVISKALEERKQEDLPFADIHNKTGKTIHITGNVPISSNGGPGPSDDDPGPSGGGRGPSRGGRGPSRDGRVKALVEKYRKQLIAAAAAVLVLVGAVFGIGSIETRDNEPTPPPYMTMMSDAGQILRQAGVAGTVSSMEVTDRLYDKKFHTYKAECIVTRAEDQKKYSVTLIYDEKDDGWVCSTMSRVN